MERARIARLPLRLIRQLFPDWLQVSGEPGAWPGTTSFSMGEDHWELGRCSADSHSAPSVRLGTQLLPICVFRVFRNMSDRSHSLFVALPRCRSRKAVAGRASESRDRARNQKNYCQTDAPVLI